VLLRPPPAGIVEVNGDLRRTKAMPTDTAPLPRTVDLTGLPESVVEYVHHVVRHARGQQNGHPVSTPPPEPFPKYVSCPPPMTAEEFRALLDHMASLSSGQSLPPDWSRADLYDDHD
jgi:hypothetical protein